jgi:hypothetical protein
MGLDTKIYWLTDRQSQCDLDLSCQMRGGSARDAVKTEPEVVKLKNLQR